MRLCSILVAACLTYGLITMDTASAQAQRPRSGPFYVKMPGKSFRGPLPELDQQQRLLHDALKQHVQVLAADIGERNVGRRLQQLNRAAQYIETTLTGAGHTVRRQTYRAGGRDCHNLECELPGTTQPSEIVIVGAHYDTQPGCPGANDNGSGTAAMLVLARAFAERKPGRTLRFVAFANEESPYFQTRQMGSWIYASRSKKRREKIVAMLSLETIGYYSDRPGSQQYPASLRRHYPSAGNFIGFVGNVSSSAIVAQAVTAFRRHAKFPSEGGALPESMDSIGRSDQWSFWRHGYPGLMVTDTAPYRYPHYHRASDTPDKLNYDRMSRVVAGLEHVIEDLAKVPRTESTTDVPQSDPQEPKKDVPHPKNPQPGANSPRGHPQAPPHADNPSPTA